MWSKEIIDKALFDQIEFEATLNQTSSPIPLFKDVLKEGNSYLNTLFDNGTPIKTILYKRAWLIDQLLLQAWLKFVSSDKFSLVAVGGYGRRELHPQSDVDLLILKSPWVRKETEKQLSAFITFLWDIGLEVGHSVRTIKECTKAAQADITIITNIMESRFLVGNENLFEQIQKATRPTKIWPSRKFFEAKLAEQIQRHQKFDTSEHNLEPNLKEGPGGLRDQQTIDWVAKRHFGATRFSELMEYGFLTKAEYKILDSAREFLWQVRFALHDLTGRHEERLLFDYQRSIAKRFGHEEEGNSGIEQFMKRYHQTVRELSRLNEMLLQHFQEEIVYARRKEKIKPLNNRFQIRNDFIEVVNKGIFKRHPFALLELFLLIQQNPNIKGVRATTIRLIRESLNLINNEFRQDIRSKSLFIEIMRQPHSVGHELRRMHRYGVLGAYLPEFARIEGLMQFDLFHIYTVDEHILFVIRQMRFFGLEEYKEKYPVCNRILKQIPKQELLYIAGIYHDIAKGRGGDHSEKGSEDALHFCRNHQLSEFDSRLVAWLVENHLLMSKTAQREDTNDPDTINRFATRIGDLMHLNYLYLLTVADINGTNPKLWNSWKASLLVDLYEKTAQVLRRGLQNPIDKEERIQEVKEQARIIINNAINTNIDTAATWDHLGEDYFIRYSPDEIAWHTRAIAKSSERNLPLILIREMTDRGGTEIFIYTLDHTNLFSRMTAALDRLDLNIVDARIITSDNGYSLDTYIVLESSGEIVKGAERKKTIKNILKQELKNLAEPLKRSSRMKQRRLKSFPLPTRVSFTQDDTNQRTILEVTASDRPGFLSSVGMALEVSGANLQSAKIATYGERVEDIFFITDQNDMMITDVEKLDKLSQTITDLLSAK